MQLEGGSDLLIALSYYYYNDYAAVAALCGLRFREYRKHDTAGPVCSVTSMFLDLA